MKKFALIIFVLVVMFSVTNLVYSQDCGKCPSKSDCNSPKAKAVDNADPMVYASKTDTFYHKKECDVVVKAAKDVYKETKLSDAVKAGLKPCTVCKPPVQPVVKTTQTTTNK